VQDQDPFSGFVKDVEPRLRRALIAASGPEVGRECTADALVYAWRHWDRVSAMDNPAGYLYRVGRSAARKYRIRSVRFPPESSNPEPIVEPGLDRALAGLSGKQRAAVLLVKGYGMTYREVADLLDLSRATVQQHVDRALAKLRRVLEVTHAG
jgi:RNA polymerase sigma-70 factor (ECF subfamily)